MICSVAGLFRLHGMKCDFGIYILCMGTFLFRTSLGYYTVLWPSASWHQQWFTKLQTRLIGSCTESWSGMEILALCCVNGAEQIMLLSRSQLWILYSVWHMMDLPKANTAYHQCLLHDSSLAAAVTEKPQVPAFDLALRSLCPSTTLHQKGSRGHMLCLCSSLLVRAGFLPAALGTKGQNTHWS